MPLSFDATTEAAIAAGRIKTADLVDFYVKDGAGDPLTLRAWSWPGQASYPANDHIDGTDNVTYESLEGRMTLHKAIRLAATLSSEPLRIILDASRSTDDDDWVGKFVDARWHQMKMRVRQVVLNWSTHALADGPLWEWKGLLDHREKVDADGEPSVWNVTCQGGLFRVRGRRLKTRSHADQQRRSAGDNFYIGTANMVGRPLVWSKDPRKQPGSPVAGKFH